MSEFSAFRNGSTYNCGKITKTTKEYERNETRERKRNLLYLIAGYLREQNLCESADTVANEAQLSCQFELCDNIDLDIIYQDFESYYFTKFNKSPKIIKKLACESKIIESAGQKRKQKSPHTVTTGQGVGLVQTKPQNATKTFASSDFQIDVTSLTQKHVETNEVCVRQSEDLPDGNYLLSKKPLCEFEGYNPEWRELADMVIKELAPKNLGVNWGDCIGVDGCIELLKEAVVYPLRYPDMFKGLISPWKGILLYGPPGTGKTLLAKAVASEASTTFINVSSSSFISKWRGESEKMVKVLFDVARHYAPTTIFIDEVDALVCKSEDCNHDASRRFKSELLTQLDGLRGGDEQVFVLSTTNSPWNLDPAMLRRFEKRILLPLPTLQSRAQLFRHFFHAHPNNDLEEGDYRRLAELTENYSGSDIRLVCKEVIMGLLREKLSQIASKHGKVQDQRLRSFSLQEVEIAIKRMNCIGDSICSQKYTDWARKYGSY